MRARGLAFARSRADWILAELAKFGPRLAFEDGAIVPVLDQPHRIRLVPGRRRGVWAEGSEILVSGQAEHANRRVTDWLKAEARSVLGAEARQSARRLGRELQRITIRDPKSRWGSCAQNGRLSFSWRLILAPEAVATYVVAHEVAHLLEANHGAKFWRLVDQLHADVGGAREWLKTNGAGLHRYG